MPSNLPLTLTPQAHIPTAEYFGLLPKAFAPPESVSTGSPSDIDPVSFHPPQTGARVRRIERFHDFRNDPLFTRSTQAIAARIDELSGFASEQCGRNGPFITEALGSFKRKLQESPDMHFGDALPVIHGPGKRALDEFCGLMRQPAIDASARRVTLQEFAHKLDRCGAYIGESMVRLPLALRLAQGGLHARHGQAMEHVTEQTLLSLVRAPGPDGRPPHVAMEPHIILQLRRELGLPGAAVEDHYARPGLASSALIANAREALRLRLHPSTMSMRLAIDAMDEVKSTLRQELGDDLSIVDPVNEHAFSFQRALDTSNERYGGIRATSLVEPADKDFTAGRLVSDPSLLALDLREEMTRIGLAPAARREPLASWADADGRTSLCHVENRIFFRSHLPKGCPHPELSPATLASLVHVPNARPGRNEPWRDVLAATIIENTPAEHLVGLPVKWLRTERLVTRFLERLPPSAREHWLARADLRDLHNLPDTARAAFTRWRAQEDLRREEARITTFEAALGDNDPMRLSEVTQALLRDSPRRLAGLLENGLLEQCLSAGQSVSAEVLLGALHVLTLDGVLGRDVYRSLLRQALSDEALTHEPARTAWLHTVKAGLKDQLLSPEDVKALLLKPGRINVPAWFWTRLAPPPGAVRGWASLALNATRLGILERSAVREELALAARADSPYDMLMRKPESFAEQMAAYVEAARDGDEFMRLMRAGPSVTQLLLNDTQGVLLGAFVDAAIAACLNKLITTPQFLELISLETSTETPLFPDVDWEKGREKMHALYLRKLVVAAVTGALPVKTLTDMLLRRDQAKRPVIAGASKEMTNLFVKTIEDLRVNELLTPREARRLQADVLKAVRAK